MSDLFFANDAPSAKQVEYLVAQFADDLLNDVVAKRGWILLDAALVDQDRIDACIKHWNGKVHNALAGSSLSAFSEYAPHFLECSNDKSELLRQAGQLIALVGDATALSWIQSACGIAELQSVSAYLAKVWIHKRKDSVHCRFADTRVLPELLKVLASEQVEPVKSVISRWYWFGRQGETKVWRGGENAERADFLFDKTLRFDIPQFRAMQRAAETDGIFLMLCLKTPELIPSQGRGALHARLCTMLEKADQLHVSGAKERLQFVVLSLSCGEDFHAIPELQPTWRALSAGGTNFLAAMHEWTNEIWASLDRRRAIKTPWEAVIHEK